MSVDASDDTRGFIELGLRRELVNALSGLGYEEPTPVQREAIPPLLQGRDLLGQAPTGTGKTAAFALPVLERLTGEREGPSPAALVLVPTRELAIQVSEAVHRYGHELGASVLPVYGGQPIGRQMKALSGGIDVVVATPGRALDHIARRTLDLSGVQVVVLDEADEMLHMGFAEDIEGILQEVPERRQTVLFSATMPSRIEQMAESHLRDPVRIQIGRKSAPPGEAPQVRQVAYVVPPGHKAAALGRVLDLEAPDAALVFCRRRVEVEELAETLNARGYRAEALHGGMDQQQRERVMGRLRSGAAELIVATDVAARGLDIGPLTHVVNYDVPTSPESYVHRIGRVGRAGREGVAITLVQPREHRMLKTIERVTKQAVALEKLPTIADLRARRLELTRDALHESILEDDLDRFRVVVEPLAEEFDLMEVALAAVKLAHEATAGPADEEEIPETRPPTEKGRDGAKRGERTARAPAGKMSRVFIGAGRTAGIRPQDVVGAIAGESRLSGREIGAIEIADRFTLVEVPESAADEVITALRGSTLKGKKPTVRRERYERHPRRS
ncbi:MAG: ATP-dependent helicase DeaD [Gaiellales bacterium]|nr:ATP-dependent helicase DeaD [Gaiellales bacterium]